MIFQDNVIREYLKNVYFITGTPCAGKTTISRELAKRHNLFVYDMDEEFEKHRKISNPAFQPSMNEAFMLLSTISATALSKEYPMARMKEKVIVTCSEIVDEIKDKDIICWLNMQQCDVLDIDDEVQMNVRKIVTDNPKMIEFTGKSGTSSGDAFLIATAMKYGLAVITEENPDKPTKIPQICKKYGLQAMNITKLCEVEGWKF